MDPLGYYDRNIPCLAACPVHTNAGAYVAAIADGDDLTAYLTARFPNPFPSVCGRVCAAPCEDACRRGSIDEPIAIRALKRFVTERHGVEAGVQSEWNRLALASRDERDQSIAVIGGGPAGLSCAHDLRLAGFQVTIYEAMNELGGMMRLGIPEYRLDRSLLDAEIGAIIELGVDVQLGVRLGTDITLDEIRGRHDGVFLGFGACLGRGLDIPGHDADGVFRAMEFLLNINLGFHVDVGERVVVVGGGNVAMDAARTAMRASAYEQATHADRGVEVPAGESAAAIAEAVDVARSAMRAGATDVTVIALENRDEMPATDFEIEEALEEGIEFQHRRGPLQVEVTDGAVTGLATVGVRSVFDQEGRFAPVFEPDDVATIVADTVILAIGQAVDVAAVGDAGPNLSSGGTIEVGSDTTATSLAGVWAGGDAAHGPRNLIDAIADGRRAAEEIGLYFGDTAQTETVGTTIRLESFQRMLDLYDRRPRVSVPSLPTERRIGLREVETGFTEDQARAEAARCLRCFANIQLDVNRCVLCALCVDVCPYDLISLEPISNLDQLGSALLLDESRCIRCALCIDRCPTDALDMQIWMGVGIPAIAEPVEVTV